MSKFEALEVAGRLTGNQGDTQKLGLELIAAIAEKTRVVLPVGSRNGSLVKAGGQTIFLPVPTEGDLREVAHDTYKEKVDLDINVPQPHKGLRESLIIASDLGWPIAGHFIPALNEELLRSLNKPLDGWYWESRANKNIKVVARGNYWVAFDTSIRPDYTDGTQLFEHDYLANMIARLRNDDDIPTLDRLKEVPQTRFAVCATEVDKFVALPFAKTLHVNEKWAGVPYAEEANFLGNMFYTHIGKASTWEWYRNPFGAGGRLDGGSSVSGGLAGVSYWPSDDRPDFIAFRLQVSFPSN